MRRPPRRPIDLLNRLVESDERRSTTLSDALVEQAALLVAAEEAGDEAAAQEIRAHMDAIWEEACMLDL